VKKVPEELTGYKKKMAMLGFKMMEEERNSQAVNSVEKEKTTENKVNSHEFK
jgi:hypothetical protein